MACKDHEHFAELGPSAIPAQGRATPSAKGFSRSSMASSARWYCRMVVSRGFPRRDHRSGWSSSSRDCSMANRWSRTWLMAGVLTSASRRYSRAHPITSASASLDRQAKRDGRRSSPVALMTASHLVYCMQYWASSRHVTLPLAMTGMPTLRLTARITSQSAGPSLSRASLTRPCTASTEHPAASSRLAKHTVSRTESRMRILQATGIGRPQASVRTISSKSSGSSNKYAP
mmetsp:Transcript_59268/g.105782  ORF Transcript_59268/g.105782 Transcript_59268/m.105782 type:complete len:231 (-) Transcript_59268:65-757(-)